MITHTLSAVLPLALLATTTKEKLVGLIMVLGLSTVVLFSIGFLAMALVANRNMREEEERPKPKTRAPASDV